MADLQQRPMADLRQAQRRVNTVFSIFAHHRRRYALRGLRMHDGAMTLTELADEVAIREHEAPITDVSDEAVTQVYLSLVHTHIPKLAAADFVQYDRERDLVSRSAHAERVERYQELLTVE